MRPYLSTARRYRWLLAAILTLVWGAGIAAAFVEYTTTYESGATIWVLRAPAELIQRNPSDPTITSVQTVAVQQGELLNQLLLTKSFLRDVVQRTSLSGDLAAATDEAKYLEQMRKRFRVEVLGTNLLMVSFTAHDPRTPPELVNAVLAVRDERVAQARVADTAVVGALYQKDFEIAQGQALEAQQRLEEFDATHRPPLNTVDEHVQAGEDLVTALRSSGRRRFRPVLMTSLAAMLGMLPLALALGSGSELLQPMAICVIGGLLFALMLSLVVTPTIYALLRRSSSDGASGAMPG